jgi:hypothetical protein
MDADLPAPRTPLTWAHIARTEGGLRITMTNLQPADESPWVMRLPYEWADELATVLVTDQPYTLVSTDRHVTLAYLPNWPEPGDGALLRFVDDQPLDLRNATYQVHSPLEDLRELGWQLRAHIEELPPLPTDTA